MTAVDDGWNLVHTILDDMRAMVEADAETELERLEGLRALWRIAGLTAELNLDQDPANPQLFSMNTAARFVGGPNPDGEYPIVMIDGRHRYRLHGTRGTSTYLGLQVLAGIGLTPRRMGAHLSDDELPVGDDGRFALVLSADEPTEAELGGASWLQVPEDASAVVVREYLADRAVEERADLHVELLDDPGTIALPTDESLGEQLTSMGWTIAKLATLHRSIKPELVDEPNVLVTAGAAELGADATTPDNLYMLGTFRLAPEEALVLDIAPPNTRYWSVTAENIWHECLEPRRRRSSLTNAGAVAGADGRVRVVLAGSDPGAANWVDTGGRHRGWVVVRWLGNPMPPAVDVRVVPLADAGDR